MSFLRNPDVHTEGLSTKSKDEILQGTHWSSRPKIWVRPSPSEKEISPRSILVRSGEKDSAQ